jgi:thioredoxin-like negative regulator of GroEL
MRASYSLPVLALSLLLPVGGMAADTAAGVQYLPGGGTRMSYDQRVQLNSRWDLGYYLFQMQEFGAAAKEFEKIRAVLPKDASLLALIGSCYSMSGQWKQGEKALLEAKAQSPDDEDINGLLGQFYLTAGQALKGAAYLEHSLKATPEQDDLRARLATLYLDAGQPERARYHLEWLLRGRGEEAVNGFGFPELDYDYARCLLQSGKAKESLVYAGFAQRAEPSNPRYARVLGLAMMANQRYAEAAAMLSQGRTELQAEELVYLQWGEALFLDRKWDEAEAVWIEGISRFPSSYPLLSRLSEYYVATARPAKALRVLRFGEDRNPGHPGNRLLEARLNRKLGEYAAAGKALDRLKRMACGAMANEAVWEEAQLDYATGKFASCDKALDRLLQAKHRKAEAHLLKAKLALYRGQKEAAQMHVRQAREEAPATPGLAVLVREAFAGAADDAQFAALLQAQP